MIFFKNKLSVAQAQTHDRLRRSPLRVHKHTHMHMCMHTYHKYIHKLHTVVTIELGLSGIHNTFFAGGKHTIASAETRV